MASVLYFMNHEDMWGMIVLIRQFDAHHFEMRCRKGLEIGIDRIGFMFTFIVSGVDNELDETTQGKQYKHRLKCF